jgi:hypothetical protein
LYTIKLQGDQMGQWRKIEEMLGGIEEFLYGAVSMCNEVAPPQHRLNRWGGAMCYSDIFCQAF